MASNPNIIKPVIDPLDIPKLRKLQLVLAKKYGEGKNPISILHECTQMTYEPLEFSMSCLSRGFQCEAKYAKSIRMCAVSQRKKDAKTEAAKALVEFVKNFTEGEEQQEEDLNINQELTEDVPPLGFKPESPKLSNEAITSVQDMKAPDIKETWKEIINQLKYKDKDSVVMLAIFAINSGTGAPKYQVTEKTKDNKEITVMVTWNMFFMEATSESRLEAEQAVAFKMLNHIRDVCGLEKVPDKVPAALETFDCEEIINDEDIPDEVKKLLIKNDEILRDKKKIKSTKDRLSLFSKKIQCPVLPNYNITNVDTSGSLVEVDVECTWLTLTSHGKGNNRSIAEEAAATNMIKLTIKIIDKMDRGQFDLPPPSTEKHADPVTYLRYPEQSPGVTSVTVTSNDYLCLQSEQYLNDVIIDFYLKYLQVGRWPDNPMLQKTHIFSIYFYNRLTQKTSMATSNIPKGEMMHGNVKKWTKNVNIFEKDFIVIPINECDHWFVVIICFPALVGTLTSEARRPIMLVMDSLEDGLKNTVCTNLRSYLGMEWKAKMKTFKEFTASNIPAYCPNVPQQSNLTDCGLFLLQYVESFYEEPLTNYQVPLRSVENWFSTDCITNKRYQIAHLIQDLADNKTLKFPELEFGHLDSATKLQLWRVKEEKIVKNEPEDSKTVPETSNKINSNIVTKVEPTDITSEVEVKSSNLKRKIEPDDEEDDGKKVKDDLDYLSNIDWLEDY